MIHHRVLKEPRTAMPSPASSPPRVLLVGSDALWREAVQAAAACLGARLDLATDVAAAIALLLVPGVVYDHVLAMPPFDTRSVDTLAGMLDEVVERPNRLLLLGGRSHGRMAATRSVMEPDQAALRAAIGQKPAPPVANPTKLAPRELVAALHGGGLRMRFQPILRAGDLLPIGLEALARVHTATRGILHPKDFIPVTLASGRERVLTSIASARTFLELGRQPRDDLFVSINLPIATVMHHRAVVRAVELCTVAGVLPGKVMIEVLETRTLPDLGLLRAALEVWRGHGFLTAIDDAGPALPHWRALLDLPFDVLKLDGALVADPDGHGLLETIVAEARARGRFIVAEGIEDEACLDRVRTLGVDALQGFLFARPLPALAVPVWLRQHAATLAQLGRGEATAAA
jgi:EAL domain-containing protein (putative c-di-GMP-specific phosphodiesterase class I)